VIEVLLSQAVNLDAIPKVIRACETSFILFIIIVIIVSILHIHMESTIVIFFRYLQVKRDHEDHRVEKAGVNVTSDILIVEGNVDPSTCTG